jgi:hypothetical protein
MKMADKPHPIFEDTYPIFEFAPLVEIALWGAEWIKRRFSRTFADLAGARWGNGRIKLDGTGHCHATVAESNADRRGSQWAGARERARRRIQVPSRSAEAESV